MNEFENYACDAAGNLLDMFLGVLGPDPKEEEIEKATKRYIAAVLMPLFEPLAPMPQAERVSLVKTLIDAVRETTMLHAETILNHKGPSDASN